MIILSGLIITVALVVITTMLNDIIFVSSSSSIETLDPNQGTLLHLQRLVADEFLYARKASGNNATNFTRYVDNFTGNLTRLMAATRGISVHTRAYFNESGILNNSHKVAYCCGERGNCSASNYSLLSWMEDIGWKSNASVNGNVTTSNYTDFGTCDALLQNTTSWCQNSSQGHECGKSDFNATVFESSSLTNDSLDDTLRSRLLNWTNKTEGRLERKFIYIGDGFLRTSGRPVLEVLMLERIYGQNITEPTYSPATVDSAGVVCNPDPSGDAPRLLNRLKAGDTVSFYLSQYPIYNFPASTWTYPYVHIRPMSAGGTCSDAAPPGGIAINWTRTNSSTSRGHIYVLPGLRGTANDSGGFFLFRENLRPIFNIFGTCRVELTLSDGRSTINTTVYC